MRWLTRCRLVLLARLRGAGQRHATPPTNRHELRDMGLLDRGYDQPSLRDGRSERTGGRDPYSW